jgi:hypothetical protein
MADELNGRIPLPCSNPGPADGNMPTSISVPPDHGISKQHLPVFRPPKIKRALRWLFHFVLAVPKRPSAFAPEVCGLGKVTVRPAFTHSLMVEGLTPGMEGHLLVTNGQDDISLLSACIHIGMRLSCVEREAIAATRERIAVWRLEHVAK